MCHWRANESGSSIPASTASLATNALIVARCSTLARRTRLSTSVTSSSTLTNEHPSNASSWNQSWKNVEQVAM